MYNMTITHYYFLFFPYGFAVLGERKPSLVEVSKPWFLTIGKIPWMGDRHVLRRLPSHGKIINTSAFIGIRIHNPSNQTVKTQARDRASTVILTIQLKLKLSHYKP
jgi:hypothetical protein